jgi:hypothetical protein
VCSECRCALSLRYDNLVVTFTDEAWFHLLDYVHRDFPNAGLQNVFANQIKRVQACIDARGPHFQHLFVTARRHSERRCAESVFESN